MTAEQLEKIANNYYFTNTGSVDNPVFKPLHLDWIDSNEICEVGNYFNKYKDYPYPIPKDNEKRAEYVDKFKSGLLPRQEVEFWVREDDRRREGMLVNGKLEGKSCKIKVSGSLYFKLNYTRIFSSVVETGGRGDDGTLEIFEKSGRKEFNFPKFWDGQFILDNAKRLARHLGMNFPWVKARRIGASFDGAAEMLYNAHRFKGSKNVVLAEAERYIHHSDLSGFMDKVVISSGFINTYTIFYKEYTSITQEGLTFGRYPKGSKDADPKSFLSSIGSVVMKNNPNASAGSDFYLALIEEAGEMTNLTKVLGMNLAALEDGALKTGMIALHGTATAKAVKDRYFIKIIEDPRQINGIVFEDLAGEKSIKKTHSFFYPKHLSMVPFIDESGISNLNASIKYLDSERDLKKEVATEEAYRIHVSQYPMSIEDVISGYSIYNILPAELLKEQYDRISSLPVPPGIPGMCKKFDNSYKFIPNAAMTAAERHEPIDISITVDKQTDPIGCFVQYREPYLLNGKVPEGLYSMSIDPHAVDKIATKLKSRDSYSVALVHQNVNAYTDIKSSFLVGVYISRIADPLDFAKNCACIAGYYNIKNMVLYEANRGRIADGFKSMGEEDRLMLSPRSIADVITFAETQKYGIVMTTPLKFQCLNLLINILNKVTFESETATVRYINYIQDKSVLHGLLSFDGSFTENNDVMSAYLIHAIVDLQLSRFAIESSIRKSLESESDMNNIWKTSNQRLDRTVASYLNENYNNIWRIK